MHSIVENAGPYPGERALSRTKFSTAEIRRHPGQGPGGGGGVYVFASFAAISATWRPWKRAPSSSWLAGWRLPSEWVTVEAP